MDVQKLITTAQAIVAPGKGILGTVAWRLGEMTTYALEGSVLVSGALIQWLGEGLGLFDSLADVENLARSVEDAGELVIVPAFAGLGTPHWDADARGLMIGITRGTGPGQIARAFSRMAWSSSSAANPAAFPASPIEYCGRMALGRMADIQVLPSLSNTETRHGIAALISRSSPSTPLA